VQILFKINFCSSAFQNIEKIIKKFKKYQFFLNFSRVGPKNGKLRESIEKQKIARSDISGKIEKS
jgi:hypothetical protein